ncbi:MAG: sigma-70 family RNA polymerase sigma factor [Deltaproteobacteria bacterium]|nr:MAG: sigma-70 family RNA polymerase sigma factor [Deltaproteobacteria bacterium]
MIEVELIYRSDCPNVEPARALLREALREAGLPLHWREWRLDAPDAPAHTRGYGSPTVLVDHRDITGGAPTACDACCRIYPGAEGESTGVPSLEQILEAIRRDAQDRCDVPVGIPVAEKRGAVSEAWPDEALMAAYQQGDARAFECLFDRYQDRLYGYFIRRFHDREIAADLFQRTFLRVHRARKRYDPGRSFATWVFGIASNLGKDEAKRRRRRPGDAFWTTPERAVEHDAAQTPEEAFLAKEAAGRIEAALASLPASQREVIVLHKIEGLSFPEIAERLGERVEAVKSRAFRGYRALRRILDSERGR